MILRRELTFPLERLREMTCRDIHPLISLLPYLVEFDYVYESLPGDRVPSHDFIYS